MRRGFSATTFVLVAVLLGALLLIGRTVIPPPPGPPAPPPVQKPNDQVVVKKEGPDAATRAKRMKDMQTRMIEEQKRHQKPIPRKQKKFDPTQIEIAPGWNHTKDMGDKGNQEMAVMVAKAKAEQAAAKKAQPVPPTPNAPAPNAKATQ